MQSISGVASRKPARTSDRKYGRFIARRQLSESTQDIEDFVVRGAVRSDTVSVHLYLFLPVLGCKTGIMDPHVQNNTDYPSVSERYRSFAVPRLTG